jgi:hypothetical protein
MDAVQDAAELNDIIRLNIGGQRLSTKRATLCRVEGSFLASMFSGRWRDHEHDHDGAVFLDYNPEFFVPVLNYLRAMEYATPENPPWFPQLREGQMKNFKRFIQYLGLSDEIFPPEKFNQHSSSGVTLEEGGTVAVHGPNDGHSYVLGEIVYQQGIVRFKMKLESFENNNWMLVGIAKADVAPPNNKSHAWPGSYGWALGQTGGVFKYGSCTIDNVLSNVTKQGDTVELVLDCDAAKLSLHLSTGQHFHIEIPKSQTWRLNVNLRRANDKVRIIHDNV